MLFASTLYPDICCSGLCCHDAKCAMCRFVTLIDVLYEHRIRVFCSADGEPMDLFVNVMTLQEARTQRPNMVSCCFQPSQSTALTTDKLFDCTHHTQ